MELVQELQAVMDNQEGYKFTTDKLIFSTTELKGEKQAFVTGYISVPEVDLYNDLVTMTAMKSMLNQMEESTITIDFEHEAWRDDNSILPVAKIIEAKVDDKGLWVKAILNKNSPKYKALWGSIQDGFVNAFSIAFQPIRTVEKSIGNVTVRLIEELKLLNVAFTGAPVNQGAIMTEFGMKDVMLKAIAESEKIGDQVIVPKSLLNKFVEEKNMTEEKIEETQPVEEVKTEEVIKEEPKTEEVKTEEPVEDPKTNELITELKSMVEKQNETIEKQNAEIKALAKKDVFKSPVTIKPEVKAVEIKTEQLSLIK